MLCASLIPLSFYRDHLDEIRQQSTQNCVRRSVDCPLGQFLRNEIILAVLPVVMSIKTIQNTTHYRKNAPKGHGSGWCEMTNVLNSWTFHPSPNPFGLRYQGGWKSNKISIVLINILPEDFRSFRQSELPARFVLSTTLSLGYSSLKR